MVVTDSIEAWRYASTAMTYFTEIAPAVINFMIVLAMLTLIAYVVTSIIDRKHGVPLRLSARRVAEIEGEMRAAASEFGTGDEAVRQSEQSSEERPSQASSPRLDAFRYTRTALLAMSVLGLVLVTAVACVACLLLVTDSYPNDRWYASNFISVWGFIPCLIAVPLSIASIAISTRRSSVNARVRHLDELSRELGGAGRGFEKEMPKPVPTALPCAWAALIIALVGAVALPVAFSELYGAMTVMKPVIYLYPEEEITLTVELGSPEDVTCSYPLYDASSPWKVTASPDGSLVYTETGRELYCLYYESDASHPYEMRDKGFCVSRDDIPSFLEDSLSTLGLTPREAEEFIVYWLPRLQESPYCYMRFATADEIDANMPLSFSVEPDTLIRVMMTYKPLAEPIEVMPQELSSPERAGFVAVEWGGTRL